MTRVSSVPAGGISGGGVDWSALTPTIVGATMSSVTITDVLNINGAGYLFSVSQILTEFATPTDLIAYVSVIIDGATKYAGPFGYFGIFTNANYAGGATGGVIAGLFRFNTSLRVRQYVSDVALTVTTIVSYGLE